jgi:diadenosine tetraphosphate (Ap4A) HIT family hydrolase
MDNCIFCDIAGGVAPSSTVYEDDDVAAFLDHQPVNPGHLLVIPRVHASRLEELDPALGGKLFQVAMRLAGSLRQTELRCDGVNLLLADGDAAGQEVFHVHLHVIPRFPEDGFGFRFGQHYGERPSKAELDIVAQAISAVQAGRHGLR